MVRKYADQQVRCRKCGRQGMWQQDKFTAVLFTKKMLVPLYECPQCFRGLTPYPDLSHISTRKGKQKKRKYKRRWSYGY